VIIVKDLKDILKMHTNLESLYSMILYNGDSILLLQIQYDLI
jgi:hypothetical protein